MVGDPDAVASPAACKYLRLQSADKIGPVCVRKLVDHFGSIDAVFDASLTALEAIEGIGTYRGRALLAARNDDTADRMVPSAAERGARIICWEDDEYPQLLKHTPDPPVCLFVRGRLEREDGVAMAVVGSRHCTRYGLEQSERFGAALAGAGFTIVSGLARGADGAAHRGALAAGGRTVAVLGCGLGQVYPPEHADLAEEIARRGALISELPMDAPPEAKNFLPRNRIIAGMAMGVVVSECGKRSGALATARCAAEYNREVFAVPGLISNPLAHGTNALLRDSHAKLIMCLEDVLDELGDVGKIMRTVAGDNGDDDACANPAQPRLDDDEQAIMNTIALDDTPLEHICDASGCSPAKVAATLTRLQMKGMVVQRPGNLFARRAL